MKMKSVEQFVIFSMVFLSAILQSCTTTRVTTTPLLKGNSAEEYYLHALKSIDNREYIKAQKYLDKALEMNKNFTPGLQLSGDLMLETNDYGQAIKYYKMVLNLEPENITALTNMGVTYKKMKNFPKALAVYRKILELEPEDIITIYNCGLLYIETEEYEKALEQLLRAKGLDSEYKEVYAALEYVYTKTGNNLEAERAQVKFRSLQEKEIEEKK